MSDPSRADQFMTIPDIELADAPAAQPGAPVQSAVPLNLDAAGQPVATPEQGKVGTVVEQEQKEVTTKHTLMYMAGIGLAAISGMVVIAIVGYQIGYTNGSNVTKNEMQQDFDQQKVQLLEQLKTQQRLKDATDPPVTPRVTYITRPPAKVPTQQANQTISSVPVPTPTSIFVRIPTLAPNEDKTWKTYSSSAEGFKILFPSNIKQTINADGTVGFGTDISIEISDTDIFNCGSTTNCDTMLERSYATLNGKQINMGYFNKKSINGAPSTSYLAYQFPTGATYVYLKYTFVPDQKNSLTEAIFHKMAQTFTLTQ